MVKNKNRKRMIFVVIGILVLINTIVLLMDGYNGKSILEDTIFYLIEILVTIWSFRDMNNT